MTVRNIPPIIRYTGNGVITTFAWDWDMIDDSTINVLVDNAYVDGWSEQGQTVVFETAPEDGAEIIIFRRTKVWQPDNYQPFGRFHSEKTELTMDRQTLIAQERQGDSFDPGNPNGIVGGADLHTSRQEFTFTVISERGTDAVLPMYDSDDVDPPAPVVPDPTIIWDGPAINAGIYSLPGNTNGVAAICRWRLDLDGGSSFEASANYPNYNSTSFTGWLDDDPDDDEYWMRVNKIGGNVPSGNYNISNSISDQTENVPFKMSGDGPYITVDTYGTTAPVSYTGIFNVEICKDDGAGLPDGGWVERTVNLESIFNLDQPTQPDLTGSQPWSWMFGADLQFTTTRTYRQPAAQMIIPVEGASIRFTAPASGSFAMIFNASFDLPGMGATTKTGAVNQGVLDFTTDPTHQWTLLTSTLVVGMNREGLDLDLVPGQSYVFNIKNDTPVPAANWIKVECTVRIY